MYPRVQVQLSSSSCPLILELMSICHRVHARLSACSCQVFLEFSSMYHRVHLHVSSSSPLLCSACCRPFRWSVCCRPFSVMPRLCQVAQLYRTVLSPFPVGPHRSHLGSEWATQRRLQCMQTGSKSFGIEDVHTCSFRHKHGCSTDTRYD